MVELDMRYASIRRRENSSARGRLCASLAHSGKATVLATLRWRRRAVGGGGDQRRRHGRGAW